MSTNEVYEYGRRMAVACSDPTTPASGDPVVYGQRPGVCLVSEGSDGLATVQFDGVHNFSVKGVGTGGTNAAIAEGAILYYVPGDTPKLSAHSDGTNAVRFGYAAAAVSSGATTTIPVILGY